ncbi:MAG: lysylphosphatidylglycerol synthase transmembrane domain-containing protein [Deltaproteobacteria bacterium]|nr:lysylphosphatidylglycerol synthase transmembrane domain-containing protein [Deltaproteobacteria bacterium]
MKKLFGKYKYLGRLIGLLCLLWLFFTFDFNVVVKTWFEIDGATVGRAFLLSLSILLLKFMRWHLLLRINQYRLPLMSSLSIYGSGMFWGLVSPGRMGEFSRCLVLKKRFGILYSHSAALIIFDRLYDLLLIATACLAGWLMLTGREIFLGPLILLILSGIIILKRRSFKSLFEWLDRFFRRHGLPVDVQPFREMIARNLSVRALIPLLLTGASLAVMVTQGYFLAADGYGLHFTGLQILFLVTAFSISTLVPLSIFGIGTNEIILLTLVYTWLPEFYHPEKLIAFSLSLGMINFIPAIVGSGILATICNVKILPGWCRQNAGLEANRK